MKNTLILLAAFAIIPQWSRAAAPRSMPGLQPKEVFQKFWKALINDNLTTANELIATFPAYPNSRVVESNTANAQKVTASTPPYKIAASRAIGDCAALVIYKQDPRTASELSVGPAYLIQRNGTWKLLPGIALFDRDEFVFTADQQDRWLALEKWFNSEDEKLRTQIARAFLQKPLKERVVGLWASQSQAALTWNEIKPDGDFQGGLAVPGAPPATHHGKWRIENQSLVWNYAVGKNALTRGSNLAKPDVNLVTEANSTFLVLQKNRASNNKTTYQRVTRAKLRQLLRDYRDK
jgi:hypothetical protein